MSGAAPLHPKHPERVCWGCDKYCLADDLGCGNGTIRTLHPIELFGDDWLEWCAPEDVPAVLVERDGPRVFPHDVGNSPHPRETTPE